MDYALNVTRVRDGKLRTLFKDLMRAEAVAAEKNIPMSPELLKKCITWRKSAGAWPKDE